jgi:hypothetical protein
MEKSLKSIAINNGIILGVILTVILVLIYTLNSELFLASWLGIVIILITIAFGILSSFKVKSLYNGYISFKGAFSAYFITVAIGSFFSVLIPYLLFSVIDPETGQFLNEKLIEITIETLQKFGMSEEVIEKSLQTAGEQDNFSLGVQLQTYLFRLVIFCIFGLISSLILKKTDPNAA